jgi:hypothetical protein
MSEWWTYSLADLLLFSPRTYRHLIELYNAAVWPLHLLTLAAGTAVAWMLLRRAGVQRWRIAFCVLGVAWGWVGIVFLGRNYASINWAASYFALAFVVQALLLVVRGVWLSSEAAPGESAALRWSGAALIGFALLLQPLVGPLLGRSPNQIEVFGIAPDPTVAATLGVLSIAPLARLNAVLWLIPLAWCAVSAATLWTMHDADAPLMPLVAGAALAVAAWRRRVR